ncbi:MULTISPECIES: replicative helicase loader/inhibitor [Bacillaceae]|uniref:replicative helicase loader/inhibitor n=1 Tax=Bacillaceae TaxID=186817 RepID=UPI001187B458|nr:replicative helicase loader/inhibitor [Bacillus sp. S3]QCJ42698.1 hypothetical protein FAY30_12695 [Bacillus sp. S3]
MTKHEVFKILVLIESVYPSFVTKDDTVLQWLEFGKQMDYHQVMKNVLTHIRKSPYPPTIADIIEGKVEVIKGSGQIQMESWRSIPAWMMEYTLKQDVQN